jgi:hypothetical protein
VETGKGIVLARWRRRVGDGGAELDDVTGSAPPSLGFLSGGSIHHEFMSRGTVVLEIFDIIKREIWIHTIKRSSLWIHTITISLTCGST